MEYKIFTLPTCDKCQDLKAFMKEKGIEYKEVDLDSAVTDFADYAAALGINYKTLKLYNPWLRDTSLKNKIGVTYKIKRPGEGSISLIKE